MAQRDRRISDNERAYYQREREISDDIDRHLAVIAQFPNDHTAVRDLLTRARQAIHTETHRNTEGAEQLGGSQGDKQ